VKRKPGKPHAKALHQPCRELAEAMEMPERKRRAGINRQQRREKECSLSSNGIKVVRHTR
jgi:hypothetical protein